MRRLALLDFLESGIRRSCLRRTVSAGVPARQSARPTPLSRLDSLDSTRTRLDSTRLDSTPRLHLPTMATLDSVLWYGSLAVLAIAVLPLDDWLSIAIHPIIRYALGATALVVILFFMGDEGVVSTETSTTAGHAGDSGVGDVAGQTDDLREARRKHLKEEIRRKILNDAYRDVRKASAGAVPPSTVGDDDDDDDDDDTGRGETDSGAADAKATVNQAEDLNAGSKNKEEEEEDEDDLSTNNNNNNNTWRCACENGFLPPGLLKTFGGAEAVMRMGMGQCYHKSGV